MAPAIIRRYGVEGDFRDFRGDAEPDDSDIDNPTTLESYKLDEDVVVVIVGADRDLQRL